MRALVAETDVSASELKSRLFDRFERNHEKLEILEQYVWNSYSSRATFFFFKAGSTQQRTRSLDWVAFRRSLQSPDK